MCLDIITKREGKNGYGYKIFYRNKNGKLYSECMGTSVERKYGTWLKSKGRRQTISTAKDLEKYCPGFHILTNKKAARRWLIESNDDGAGGFVIRKVRYNNVVAIGEQDKLRCVVAKEIKIEKRNIV
jgi:hypothetical protein